MDIDGIDYTPGNLNIANICVNPVHSVKYLIDEADENRSQASSWWKYYKCENSTQLKAFALRAVMQYQARADALQQAAHLRSLAANDYAEEEIS